MLIDEKKDAAIHISVCVPAYCEEDGIAETINGIAAVLTQIPGRHEILVVNDGSRDQTLCRLLHLTALCPMLGVLSYAKNMGNPAAQRTLIAAAGGRYIAQIGADGEWDPLELQRMFSTLQQGCDVVVGVRRRKDYSLSRAVISTVYNRLVTWIWGRNFHDIGSIKMAHASLWKRIPTVSSSAFIHAERLLIAASQGARIVTIPVEHTSRRTGRSHMAGLRPAYEASLDLIRFWCARGRHRSLTAQFKVPAGPV